MDEDEKREVYKFISDLSLPVPLMAGVGGINIQETIKELKYLETLKQPQRQNKIF